MLGIVLIDKPPQITSHDVVHRVRRKFNTKRVGHAGTLDPMGTGLLVVAVGPATRFLQYLPLEPKEYQSEITFGVTTDSYDAEGNVLLERPVPHDLEAQIRKALPKFKGLIDQIPPVFSAVKVAGKPLYKYARAGEEVERQSRTVHIQNFDLVSVDGNKAQVRVVCSGGTYIRTLAYDLGEAIGCGAHLTALRRTRVGRFLLTQSKPLDDISAVDLIPLREALPPMPLVHLGPDEAYAIREGRQVTLEDPNLIGLVGLIEPRGEVFSVARIFGNRLQPECVIPSEAFNGGS